MRNTKPNSAVTDINRTGLVMTGILALTMLLCMHGVLPVYAVDLTANTDGIMSIVFQIVRIAATSIGGIITLWGAFQMILAFRREDSEGVGKQVTSIVVGVILIAFGSSAESVFQAIIG